MSAEAAARMGDEIAHGFGLAAMIAGAVAGAVVGAAIVAATAATGGLAAVIIAGAVAGGGLAAGQIMSGLTTIFNLPEPTSGVVATGSPNVLTNMRPAVRAMLDVAGCTGIPMNHPPLPMPVPLAEGSATVLINNMPASRLKSKLMCGAHMKSGSDNVIIGGETARVGFVFDLEAWFKTGLEVLGIGALIGGALLAIAAGAVATAVFGAITAGGMAVFEGLGQIGDALGPGYRDLLQGVAGMGLLFASPKLARLGTPKAPPEAVEPPLPIVEPEPISPFTQRYLNESGGRWGGTATREQNYAISQELKSRGYTVKGGGGIAPEEYIPGAGPGTKGGTFVDITSTAPNGRTVRIQTVTTLADGVTPTPSEAAAAARIRAAFPNDKLLLVPKR